MKRLTKNILATGTVIAASLLGVATPSAVADTSTLGMGCFVDSWRYDYVQEGYCAAQDPALGYRVYFEVLGRSSQGYSYSWHTTSTSSPNVAFSVAYGCTSSSYYCARRCSQQVRRRMGADLVGGRDRVHQGSIEEGDGRCLATRRMRVVLLLNTSR